jgi:hypothetical protein
MESERLADAPDIELRILAVPRVQPVLAEILFPPATFIQQAKEYVCKELQELPIQVPGRAWCWLEDDDRLVWHFSEAPAEATVVTLEPGVCEWVVASADAWYTCRLEFDKKLGWGRSQAETWLAGRLPWNDLKRTACLRVPYRMHGHLATMVGDLLFERAYVVHPAARNGLVPPVMEFVAVPPLPTDERRRGHSPSPAAPSALHRTPGLPREGAGLELDLTAPRHVDRLPTELRPDLPRRGFVNYLEAVAVVRRLEQLVRDPSVVSLARGAQPAVAVLALYAGQAELIRRLVKRSAVLTQANLPVLVDLPHAFRHRETPIVLVSLTRSHNHRPASLGEEAGSLRTALTRARSKLILFGDPGTLVRRSQWQGALDHLDDSAAARERSLVSSLLGYLQGQGRYTAAFHLVAEGGGS